MFSTDSPLEGERLDKAIAARGAISRRLARRAIDAGAVFVDGKRVRVAGRALRKDEEVRVNLQAAGEDFEARRRRTGIDERRVLYKDEYLVAVDKPAGVAAQPTLTGTKALPELVSTTLGGWVSGVHRLDLQTTGVTVLGRNKRAVAALNRAFREDEVKKTYLALSTGGGPPREESNGREGEDAASGRWSGRLARNRAVKGAWRVVPSGGVSATTDWAVIERFGEETEEGGFCLMKLQPLTGRTHQLRAHLAHAGMPIVGDVKYGGPSFVTFPDGRRLEVPAMLLHALRLSLPHPRTGQMLTLEAPLPREFLSVARALGSRNISAAEQP